MTFVLPELPYPMDALEPHISRKTLEFHYGKHHRGYVDKLNKLIRGTEFENMSLEDIVKASKGAIFNNAAQAWNHEFYWKCLSPDSMGPGQSLTDGLNAGFGSIDKFIDELKSVATGIFGSGYAWLVMHGSGRLAIEATHNAKTPITQGKVPLLAIDVWEHAYYLDYQNERARYIEEVLTVLNWEFIEQNYLGSQFPSEARHVA